MYIGFGEGQVHPTTTSVPRLAELSQCAPGLSLQIPGGGYNTVRRETTQANLDHSSVALCSGSSQAPKDLAAPAGAFRNIGARGHGCLRGYPASTHPLANITPILKD